MAALLNRARMTTATTGTGTVTLGSAVTGYASFAEAGAVNATVYSYCIEDGDDFEIGVGTYTSSGTTFSRDTVTLSKISGTSGTTKINLSGTAEIFITARSADIVASERQVVSGNGLTGGGDLSADRTLAVGAGTGISVTADAVAADIGKQSIWVPATAMLPLPSDGPATGRQEVSSSPNIVYGTLDYDASSFEEANFMIAMPKSWDEGTVSFIPYWSHPSTTTNFGVVWGLQGVALSNAEGLGGTFGSYATSTDTGGSTDTLYVGPESGALTIAGSPAADDLVIFHIRRAVTEGADTMAVDARLVGVKILFTINALKDD